LHFPERWRQLYPVALQGYLNLVAPSQIQGSTQIFRDHDSSGIVNGSSHTINGTIDIPSRCRVDQERRPSKA
jgi:hypothetical protein